MITLNAKTNQQAYDKVVRHLLSAPRRSFGRSPSTGREVCKYRTSGGDRCAIGALIDDEQYDRALDSDEGSTGIMNVIASGLVDGGGLDTMLLHRLQSLHDDPTNWGPDGFTNISALRTAARDYHLSASVIDDIELEEMGAVPV